MDSTEREPGVARPTLRRTLGVFDGIAILIGITIGSGIFRTPKEIAGYHHSFESILLFWIVAGLFVYVGGLIYAELGSRLPNTGGEYVYLSTCFGPYVGFMFGWAQLFIIRTSAGAGLAIVTADYIGYFIPLTRFTRDLVALGVLAILGYLNYTGVQRASFYNKFSSIVKVGGLLLLVAIGLVLAGGHESKLWITAPPTANLGPIGNLVAAMMLIVFSYIGWDRVGYVAEEMKQPQRVVPLSMFFGMAIIMLVYLGANVIYHQVLGIEGVRTSTVVASETATHLIGPTGAALVALMVIVSASGSINGTMMTASRAYYAMAKDRLFFKWLDYVHPEYRTPSRAVVAHCVWAAAILLIRGKYENIVAGMTFAVLIFYTLTTLALFKLRKQQHDTTGIYQMPLYPLLPVLYLAGIVVLLALRGYYEWQKSLADLAFIASGIPFAFYWCRRAAAKS